jgi:asparagine synthase (glutamine-hydrolysing)
MSGFLGVYRQDGAWFDERLLDGILQRLRFRGSDAQNVFLERDFACCFSFLEVSPGRQSSRQPVVLDSRYWLVGDVRLDGRADLIADLAKHGPPPEENATDEELLLQAWRLWGEACLQRIIGDFSFALHDTSSKMLWCVRDFVGTRPFYYSHVGKVFAFSNSLQVLRAIPEISTNLNEVYVGDFLLHGFSWEPTNTVYRDIQRLPPGHLLQFSEAGLAIKRYIVLPVEEPLRLKRDEEYLEAYRELLHEVVQDRLPGGNVALFLSGGLDSGTVCAFAAQIAAARGQREMLKAFTADWRPFLDDTEAEFAILSAKHLGLAHEILRETNFAPFAENPVTPEPVCQAFWGYVDKLSQLAAGHARVVLSGYGGDDILTGQAWPYLVNLWTRRQWAEILRTFGGFALAHGRIPPLRGGFRVRMRRFLRRQGEWEGYPVWLNPEFERRLCLRDRWREPKDEFAGVHPFHPKAYTSLHSNYWGTVFDYEDVDWTRTAMEVRAPLLDLRLTRFLLRVPPVPLSLEKELNRRSMRKFLPDAIIERSKTPLVDDPLEVCLERGLWHPEPLESLSAQISSFVMSDKWVTTLSRAKCYTSVTMAAPFALADWFKAIENAQRIE